jgi:hypothetical protein
MKKIITVATAGIGKMQAQGLTIGLDLGDRSSCYCVLNQDGEIVLEQKVATTPKSDAREIRGNAKLPDGTGDRNPFSVVESPVERVGARSDRGARAESRTDCKEPPEERPHGCADPGSAGQDRPHTAVSDPASQRRSAGTSDRDPGSSRPGASPDRADQHSPGSDEVRWENDCGRVIVIVN